MTRTYLEPTGRTQRTRMVESLRKLHGIQDAIHDGGVHYSDIVDEQGHQYVDLVLEGGGVLGIALAGYVFGLEHAGLRFLGLGGASAGSIVAFVMSVLGNPSQPKGPRLLEYLAGCDMASFLDGDDDCRDLIRTALSGAGRLKLAFKAVQCLDTLNNELGLCRGDAFQRWVSKIARQNGVTTRGELRRKMLQDLPPLFQRLPDGSRQPATIDPHRDRLKVVAADLTTETKVVFPEMADLYWGSPEEVEPELFVRASMSIPYFFRPLRVDRPPRNADWTRVGFQGPAPARIHLVDGGIMSNFPIDLFHDRTQTPTRPTLGARLDLDRVEARKVEGPLDLFWATFDASRHCRDFEFFMSNPDFEHLVGTIMTQPHNWLDFEMPEEDKVDLFTRGVESAARFLADFDWPAYRAGRTVPASSPAPDAGQPPRVPVGGN